MPLRQSGVVMFADVAGFTRLTEAAVEGLGPLLGADVLTTVLERLFSTIVDPVTERRGSVIDFLGDAFVAWFTGPDAAADAVASARMMQLGLSQLPPAQIGATTLPLNLKVGIGSGEAMRFLLGTPEHVVFDAIAGPALAAALECEAACEQGEIIVDAVTLAGAATAPLEIRSGAAGPLFSVEVINPGPRPAIDEPPPVDVTEALTRTPANVRDEVAIGDFQPDIRPAVTIFMAFDGVDPALLGPEPLAQLTAWAQDVVAAHGGTVIRSGAGDKNTHLIASFGAPAAIDRMDDQAVAAAVALLDARDAVAGLHDVRIGVATGQVYSGEYGGTERRVLSILGSSVNLAARLMGVAEEGTVLVQRELADRIDRHHEFGPPIEYTLKGFAEPVEARPIIGTESISSRAATSRASMRLIGRDEELELLTDFLDAPHTPRPHLVIGEAGVGKSRVLAEVLRLAAQRRLPIITGAADVTQRLAPFHAFRSVFNQLLDAERPLDMNELRDRLGDATAGLDNVEILLSSLRTVLPLERRAAQIGGDGPPPDLSGDATELLARVVERALARVPTALLVLDDAQWFDPSSWSLLTTLLERTPTLRILIGSRPTTSPLPATEIVLGPLTATDAGVLAAEVLGARRIAPALADELMRRTAGHPLFLVEMAAALQQSGAISLVDGVASVDEELRDGSLPDSLREVVIRRVDGLPPSARQALRAASVIGMSGTTTTLAAVAGVTGSDLDDALRILQGEALVIVDGATWALRQALFGDAVYDSLVGRQRNALHLAAANFLAEHPGLASPAVVGTHFELAGDAMRAAPHFLEAASISLSAAAYSAAIEVAEHAVALLDGNDDPAALGLTAQLLITKASAMMVTVGQFAPEVHAVYAEALAICNRLDPTPDLLGALFGLSAHYAFNARWADAAEQAHRCLDLSRTLRSQVGEGNAHMLLSMIETWRGNHAAADVHAERVLELTTSMADADIARFAQHPIVTVTIAYSISLAVRGRSDEARAAVDKAFTIAEELALPYNVAMAHNARVNMLLNLGDTDHLASAAQELLEIAQQLGLQPAIHTATSALGTVMVRQGQVDAGVETMLALGQEWTRHGSMLGLTDHHVRTAEALIAAGRLDEAQDVVDRALALEASPGLHGAELYRVAGRTSAFRMALAPDRALALYERAISIANASGALLQEIRARTDLVGLVSADADRDHQREALRAALERLDPGDSVWDLPDVRAARTIVTATDQSTMGIVTDPLT